MAESEIILAVVIPTLTILLLIAGIIIIVLIAYRKQIKQQVELAQARVSYEQELRRIEGEVSEQLMEQFARELHDNIGHILTCMRLEVENKKLDHPDIVPIIRPVENYLDEASGQLRLLSRSFNTEYISHNGLINAIGLEVERQRQLRKFTLEWKHDDGPTLLDKNQELIVFRILQEFFQNAIRHSRAQHVEITLTAQPFGLHLRDDGKGFDPEIVLTSGKASGLKNILRRCDLANLECKLKSAPGQGCSYTLSKRPEHHEQ